MIKRDQFDIIIQHAKDDPNYLDGGDSCSRTGIMARTGSIRDKANLGKFVTNDHQVVRHPMQPKFNDPKETSRDALVCFFMANAPVQKEAAFYYAKKWFVNKDFLDPAVRLFFWKTSVIDVPLWLQILGRVWLSGALLWNCFIMPEHEQNQFAGLCLSTGRRWITLLYWWHPDLNKNIRNYWSGWRDQDEIGFAYMETIRVAAYRDWKSFFKG